MSKLYEEILQGETRAISKAITLIESHLKKDRQKALQLLDKLKVGNEQKSIRIGISGIPGVGKSTFLERLGSYILEMNPTIKIALLTIDPSSPLQGGSILADRLRMTCLSKNPRVFIRPSPNSGMHGGLARRTRESILLLEACQYEIIFVETVGVGQSEYNVASLVDIFMLLQMPSTGDEWQAIKKGILELADIVIINKADGKLKESANLLKKMLENSLTAHSEKEKPSLLTCSSLEGTGIDEIWNELNRRIDQLKKTKLFLTTRNKQDIFWFEEELQSLFKFEIDNNSKIKKLLSTHKKKIEKNKGSLFSLEAEKAINSLVHPKFRK